MVSQVDLTVTDNTCSGSPRCGQGLSAVPAEPQGTVFCLKIGAKVVTHSRYVFFQMAEVAVPRALFRAILERIHRLWLPQAVPR